MSREKKYMNFWNKLPKPFFCLAPMADVTDPAFRRIVAKYDKPDIMWTEFISADGLMSDGRKHLNRSLQFSEKERPIVAQLFSANPEKMRGAVKYCVKLGFDGIDINMGCPDSSVEKQGAGAALMKNPKLAGKIIQAVKDGIKDAKKEYHINRPISISVKTRAGYNKENIDEWIPFLLSQNIDVLTIHARTRRDMSKVPANWDYVKRVVEIRNKMKIKTKIIGNGDVLNLEQGRKLAKETGCDGIMIGRVVLGNPFLFSEKIPTIQQKLKVLVEHAKLFPKYKSFNLMKKHFKAYVSGFIGAKELRLKLMQTNSAKEVETIISEYIRYLEVRLPDI